MATIAEIRRQYPQYNDMDDRQLADALYAKHYSDMPRAEFDAKVGLAPSATPKPANTRVNISDMRSLASPAYAKAREGEVKRDQRNQRVMGLGGQLGQGLGDFTDQVVRNIGVNDELQGGAAFLAQGTSNLVNRALGRPTPVSAGTAAQAAIDYDREKQAQYARERPGMNALATAGGIVASARPTGVPAAMNPLQAGGQAAAVNAPFALARQEGSLSERMPGFLGEEAMSFGMGAGLQAAGNAIQRSAAAARARPATPQRQLSQQGVDLTPGQILGGTAQRVEDALTSTPVLGDAIRQTKVRGLESFNRAAYNQTLAPIGGALPDNVNVGRDAMREATQQVRAAYDAALTGVRVAPDAQFAQELATVRQTPNLTVAQRETLDQVTTDLASRMNGVVDGDLWKVVDSDLGKAIRAADHASASQPGGTILRDALIRLRDSHQALLGRVEPQAAAGVTAADEATANLMRLRQASQYTGTSARGGVFSPADLNRAVQGMDTSAGNRAFASGDALMQNLTDPAAQVLPTTVPDSGTALRSLMGLLTTGGATVAGAGAVGAAPIVTPAAVGIGSLVAAGTALYSRPVQAAINAVYRASTPGQAREALSRLAMMAARDPALTPAYEAAARQVAGLLPPSAGQPGGPQARPVPMTR